jgi:hypothetical protein
MEITPGPKRLPKHAVPIALIILLLLPLPAVAFSHYNSANLRAEVAVARALVSGVVGVKPNTNGLARLTAHHDSSPPAITTNLDETGRATDLSFTFNQ